MNTPPAPEASRKLDQSAVRAGQQCCRSRVTPTINTRGSLRAPSAVRRRGTYGTGRLGLFGASGTRKTQARLLGPNRLLFLAAMQALLISLFRGLLPSTNCPCKPRQRLLAETARNRYRRHSTGGPAGRVAMISQPEKMTTGDRREIWFHRTGAPIIDPPGQAGRQGGSSAPGVIRSDCRERYLACRTSLSF